LSLFEAGYRALFQLR